MDVKECCKSGTSSRIPPKRARCPVNGEEYSSVGVKTILHHLAEPWRGNLKHQSYYYCTDANCDVVYFGQDDSLIAKSALRTKVGVKEHSPERSLCYCFGVSYAAAENSEAVKEFVTDMTRQSLCCCETSNPSGRCCLKDFPKQ
jgi:hypothetical protein